MQKAQQPNCTDEHMILYIKLVKNKKRIFLPKKKERTYSPKQAAFYITC